MEAATNPLWSRVKMDDDGRVGLVSSSRLEDMPEEAPLPDPSGDELPDPSEDEDEVQAVRPPLEAVEGAIESFYESVGGDMEVTFCAADIIEELSGGPYQEAAVKAAIEALCKAGVDGVSAPAYKVAEGGKYCVIDQ